MDDWTRKITEKYLGDHVIPKSLTCGEFLIAIREACDYQREEDAKIADRGAFQHPGSDFERGVRLAATSIAAAIRQSGL